MNTLDFSRIEEMDPSTGACVCVGGCGCRCGCGCVLVMLAMVAALLEALALMCDC